MTKEAKTMTKEAKTIPTWGYNKDGEGKIFDLKEGGDMPQGWADSPAKFKAKNK